ncbi:MAG: hypothetical protein U9R69_00980 [Thermodesulfobacteriota bacterium]|nr:hypothetical protein [Thermodesulfobacteriota bacterium]
MTKMLDNAFAVAAKLPAIEQNTLARWMIEEIESDKKWDKLFAESEDTLSLLAIEALDEESSGLTDKVRLCEARTTI